MQGGTLAGDCETLKAMLSRHARPRCGPLAITHSQLPSQAAPGAVAPAQVGALRQLHKTDPAGGGVYTVVGFGDQCLPQARSTAPPSLPYPTLFKAPNVLCIP